MNHQHLVVYNAPLSAARARRIQKALREVNASACVYTGWLAPNFQPGFVTVKGPLLPDDWRKLSDIANNTK
jgi:hypothetical protein